MTSSVHHKMTANHSKTEDHHHSTSKVAVGFSGQRLEYGGGGSVVSIEGRLV